MSQTGVPKNIKGDENAKESNTQITQQNDNTEPSARPSTAEASIIAMSDSIFFPTSSDTIWKSATIIRGPQPPELFDLAEGDSVTAVEINSSEGEMYSFEHPKVTLHGSSKMSLNQPGRKLGASTAAALSSRANRPEEPSGTQPGKKQRIIEPPCGNAVPNLLLATGSEETIDEIATKLESGLRLLEYLAHSNSAHGGKLKQICDAYDNFTQALFHDIKVSRKTGGDTDPSDYHWNELEEQKQEIYKQEDLLESEIIEYKETKQELENVAKAIEEAAKSYRTPEVLEDATIPRDVLLSPSAQYIAEIEEIQREILIKQMQVKNIHRDIERRYLPKPLVDSICESHRLADRTLKDIADETTYLRETINRLDQRHEWS